MCLKEFVSKGSCGAVAREERYPRARAGWFQDLARVSAEAYPGGEPTRRHRTLPCLLREVLFYVP